MINPNFVIFGAFLTLVGALDYLIATVKGKAKPNRVSWFMWGLAPLIAFFAEISKGVGIQSLMTFMVGFSPLLIFGASFVNKKSFWKLGALDFICAGLSLLGLLLWYLTKEGDIAIIFAIIADGMAAIPTIFKSYNFPETENYLIYLLSGVSAVITLLTIQNWNFAHFAFPLYILLIDCVLFVLVKLKLGLWLRKL